MPTRANPASHPVTTDDPITITRSMSSRFTLEIASSQSAVGFLIFFTGALGDIVRQRRCRRLLDLDADPVAVAAMVAVLLVSGRALASREEAFAIGMADSYDALERFNEGEWMYQEALALDPKSKSLSSLYQAHLKKWRDSGTNRLDRSAPTENSTEPH